MQTVNKLNNTMTFKKSFVLLTIMISAFMVKADEGMWMLHLLKQQKLSEMQKMGLKLEDYDIYNPDGSSLKDAVVQFGGGCTGEVISSQGLVLTNHHCGYGQIQNHSSLEHNYLEDGFWAMSKDEELPNPGLTVTFIDRIEDVTDYVKQSLERDKDQDTDGVLYLSPSYLKRLGVEKLGADFFTDNVGMDVEIKPFFEGNQYFMFVKKIYSDVRLVAAPPSSIGKYGADTDNWTWPRHTGDFSVFRIYADKNGNPASYSADNVPLNPKRWLTISSKGTNENDFVMMMGFPGTTNKFYTSWEVEERRDIDNDILINMRKVRQETMLEEMLADPQVKIQYAAKYSGSTNAYKRAMGSNWATDMRDFVGTKLEQQNRVIEWATNNDKPEYVEAINSIQSIIDDRAKYRQRSTYLLEAITRGIEFANVPTASADMLAMAIESDNKEDIIEYSQRLMSDYEKFANKDYNPEVDRKVAKAMINAYTSNVSEKDLPEYIKGLHGSFDGDVNRFVDFIFDNSLFASKANIERFVDNPSIDKLTNDPMFMFAKSVRAEAAHLREKQSSYNNAFNIARKKYLEGILEMDGLTAYAPDANLTIRLAYGQLKGYKPSDAVYYEYQTTLDGVMEKEDADNWEFVVPAKLKELYRNKDFGNYATQDGRMPVAIAASTHSTGGNSGSPILNAHGELIGINFDRNWEGVGGDIQYLPDYQRSIIVDVRYVLFVIDKYMGASHLIEEMDIVH